ncbi:hypothetical protein RintRC_6258 [Richelia intracellularis]|nr:hypothetical protein RintRC_6258 [Richelia intracellularis]
MCVFNLANNRDQEQKKLYLSRLVTANAYLLPSPQIPTDERFI